MCEVTVEKISHYQWKENFKATVRNGAHCLDWLRGQERDDVRQYLKKSKDQSEDIMGGLTNSLGLWKHN